MKLIDINEVCNMLNITSRTLRFYEEEGLISGVKSQSNRRQYSINQIEIIKKIIILRTLGLTIKDIQQIQKGDSELKQAIELHKAQIISKVNSMINKLRLLDEALSTLKSNGDIFEKNINSKYGNSINNELISNLTKSFIDGKYEEIHNRFSDKLSEATPKDDLTCIIEETLRPIGKFILIDTIKQDEKINNVYYSYLRYEKLGLVIKYVMDGTEITGFWLNYYEI